jgi:hypothetical protein
MAYVVGGHQTSTQQLSLIKNYKKNFFVSEPGKSLEFPRLFKSADGGDFFKKED